MVQPAKVFAVRHGNLIVTDEVVPDLLAGIYQPTRDTREIIIGLMDRVSEQARRGA